MESIRDLSQSKAEDAHVTVHLIELKDDRFPGWTFTIRRHAPKPSAGATYFAIATRIGPADIKRVFGGAVALETKSFPLAWDALEAARAEVRTWLGNQINGTVAP